MAHLSSSSNGSRYWFEVGAAGNSNGYLHNFGEPITGASVEIRALVQRLTHVDTELGYWVGIDLPNDAFIQVGYLLSNKVNSGQPTWFWEYFLPGTASSVSGSFLGNVGSVPIPNGTWVPFSIRSSGTVWSAFVAGEEVGSIDLQESNSGMNGPYANAEVADTHDSDNVLGPVEFRNLAYRDKSLIWHDATYAVSVCCYGQTSAKLTDSENYPYGVVSIPGENNHWLAGSNLPSMKQGKYLWPWYHVSINSRLGTVVGSGWYVYGDSVRPNASATINANDGQRYVFNGWLNNGIRTDLESFIVTQDLNLVANYKMQYFLNIESAFGMARGAGWYDSGSRAIISITPTSISLTGFLGQLGIREDFTGWSGDHNEISPTSSVTMNSPKRVVANWSINFGLILPAIFAMAIMAVAWIMLKRKPARKTRKSPRRRARKPRHMDCRFCGRSIPNNSKYCRECGKNLSQKK
jgi:hypothetical protein